jgi:hypothetical protein
VEQMRRPGCDSGWGMSWGLLNTEARRPRRTQRDLGFVDTVN